MPGKNGNRAVKAEIPWELHMAIIKLQASEELDDDEACKRESAVGGWGDTGVTGQLVSRSEQVDVAYLGLHQHRINSSRLRDSMNRLKLDYQLPSSNPKEAGARKKKLRGE